jgi:hypothetical protein
VTETLVTETLVTETIVTETPVTETLVTETLESFWYQADLGIVSQVFYYCAIATVIVNKNFT